MIVVNSHLTWDPAHDIVKYAQMGYILKETMSELESIKRKRRSEHISVVCVGDFNSRPESSVLQLINRVGTDCINSPELEIEEMTTTKAIVEKLKEDRLKH